ncbi:MAG: VWA domain-containing protein [Planctomycetota bacterium]|jgi:hypothetical protein
MFRYFGKNTAFIIIAMLAFAPHAYSGDFKETKKALKAALDAKDEDAAVEATVALGGYDNLEAVKTLLALALGVESRSVFEAAVTALANITDEKGLNYIHKVAEGKDWRLRSIAAQVFAETDSDSAREAIIKLLSDKYEVVVREAIAAAVRQDKPEVFVPPLIVLLERKHKEQDLTWIAVRKALIALTGEDYEQPEDWKKAWKTLEEELKSRKKKPAKENTGDGPGFKTERMKELPRFFGTEIYSKRILFLIDVSGSMKIQEIPFIGETRLELVQIELCRCIDKLDGRAKFNVIAFSNSVKEWKKKSGASVLVAATTGNKRAAKKFVSRLQPSGHTYTDEALKAAMKDPEVDTIVLLSDGAPYKPKKPGEELSSDFIDSILKWVEINNRFRKIIIGTFGFESLEEEEKGKIALEFLKKLADQTGGKFKGISLDQ